VDLFFVLSGYLITTILLRDRGRPGALGSFYVRRSLRIWPAYYLALLLVLVLNRFLASPDPLDGAWQYATYTQFVQRYWGGEPPSFSRMFVHTWTLAIEEQFYLAWPLVVLLFGRVGVGLGALVLVVLPAVLRAEGYHRGLLLTRSDGLALGALLALVFLTDGVMRRRGRLTAGFALLGIGMLGVPWWREAASAAWAAVTGLRLSDAWLASLQITRLNLLHLALVGLVLLHQGGRALAPLRRPALVRLGRISYGVYLYHPLVFAMVAQVQRQVGVGGSTLWDVLKVGASILAAAASWRWFERPWLERRAAPGRTAAGTRLLRGPHARREGVADRVSP
jgi:peptidoglycan/LPS O-acetylase OafA/YrhL